MTPYHERARLRAATQFADHPEPFRLRGRQQSAKQMASRSLTRIANMKRNQARRRHRDANADLSAKEWAVLQAVWRGRCAYCGKFLPPGRERVREHVDPNQNGGSLTLSNIVLACHTCNEAGEKGTKTVEQWLGPRRAAAFRRRHTKMLAQACCLLLLDQASR